MIIRKATMDERDALRELIAASARYLSREHYNDQQIEAAISTVFGVDTDLIADGTYLVAESNSQLVGCGGWSKRKTLYGGDQYASRDAGYLDPESEPAKVRAFFIHPDHARKGIARAILSQCEKEARAESASEEQCECPIERIETRSHELTTCQAVVTDSSLTRE